MAEACEDCSCSLSYDDIETQTEEVPADMEFQTVVRNYVLEKLNRDDESTFIEEVKVCPERVEVTYSSDE